MFWPGSLEIPHSIHSSIRHPHTVSSYSDPGFNSVLFLVSQIFLLNFQYFWNSELSSQPPQDGQQFQALWCIYRSPASHSKAADYRSAPCFCAASGYFLGVAFWTRHSSTGLTQDLQAGTEEWKAKVCLGCRVNSSTTWGAYWDSTSKLQVVVGVGGSQ